MENKYPSSLKGQFLIAMPSLMDPNFFQTVTCISEHTEGGAVGIVINRIHSAITAKSIFDELNISYSIDAERIPVHIGGPVHIGEIFILHGPPFSWEGCLMTTSTLAMSNTIDILEAIATGRGPEFYMIALGCAGWGQGQLESEIKSNAWLTCPIVDDIVFDVPVDSRWEETVKRMGIDLTLLSDSAGHA
jgi:putative transcriptional regulator